jgi:hypothetical protein
MADVPRIPCTPADYIYLANSLATAVSEPDLYRLLTFHVHLMPLFHCLGRTKVSVQVRGSCVCFVTIPIFIVSCQHLAQPPS